MAHANIQFDIVRTVIACALGALIGWAYYEMGNAEGNIILLGIVVGVLSAAMLTGLMGLKQTRRQIASVRTLSSVFFILVLITDGIFAFFNFNVPAFVIVNGFLLLIWLLISQSVATANDVQGDN